MPVQYSDIIESFPEEVRLPVTKLLDRLRGELIDTVTRTDFDRLRDAVQELAEAQKRTETRLGELAQAQARTEARLQQLAEAQARTEERLTRLEETVQKLAEAQAKTEARLQRLEATVQKLAEAQKRTEEEVRSLARGQKEIRRELGGISHTIGYTLEAQAYPLLPPILKRDLGVEVSRLHPKFLAYPDGKEDQVNIYGEGRRKAKKVFVIGEAKAQLGKRDVDHFAKLVRRAEKQLAGPAVPLLLTYMVHPSVEKYATEKGIKVYWAYELLERQRTRR